jgi:3-dehydroquinate synthase
MSKPQRVRVALGDRSYPIFIGPGLLSHAGQYIKPLQLGNRAVIITDSHVSPLYVGKLKRQLGVPADVLEVPAGESSKSLRQVSRILERLPAMKLDRESYVVALGGGVVGDLAGFVAATYLRGIPFIQIPTSLLAMVDSSVGGKTGVNLPQGKNLVGAFHQPRLVLADIGTLTTLPARELRAGFAEVIKTAAIRDANFFAWLEKNHAAVLALDAKAVTRVVRRCCEVKADVVSRDEWESGLRAILNFGHTIGHAMEALADYRGLLHGEAVAIGMVAAAELSVRCAGLKVSDAGRIQQLIAVSDLPTRLGEGYGMPELLAAMKLDKKASAGRLRFVLLDRLGHAVVSDAVTDREIREVVHVCR